MSGKIAKGLLSRLKGSNRSEFFTTGKGMILSGIFRATKSWLKAIIFLSFATIIISLSCDGNNDKNEAPEIYDLVAPEFIPIGFNADIFFRLSVTDPQSLDDIKAVYFTIENPDGDIRPDTSYMHDNGQDGDLTNGDGIFTFAANSENTPQDPGEYIYHFKAVDKGGLSSDTLDWTIMMDENPSPYLYGLAAPLYMQIGFPGAMQFQIAVSDPQGFANVNQVFFTIQKPDSALLPDTAFMADDGIGDDEVAGDGIYTKTLAGPFSYEPTGEFIFIFKAIDLDENVSNIIRDAIVIDDRPNPFVYDLAAPDSLLKGSLDPAYLFINAWDPQGAANIDSIYFTVTRPDGTSNGIKFLMYDDGNTSAHGDSVAADGIYSLGILPPDQNSQSGNFTFYFTGIDINNNQANIIAKQIVVYNGSAGLAKKMKEYSRYLMVNDIWSSGE